MGTADRLAVNVDNASKVNSRFSIPDVLLLDIPDPETGWGARHPDRALAFLYVFPRPCSALDELMQR